MPADPKYASLPFDEAIKFFQGKKIIPTKRWDDLKKGMHAKGFMVAGANRQVAADFLSSVEKALTQGTTLEEFRKDFDSIVARHGWSYNGGRNWRSELIFSTNLRTAYAAGRYKQMTDPDVASYRPYWQYRHGGSRVPRPEHLSWDGLVLASDNPWWDTHYPPNGWGCSCRVFPLSERDMERYGKKGPDEAPPSPIDPKTGEPVGIDKGWGYNVGEAAWGKDWAKQLIDKGPFDEVNARRPGDYPWLPKKLLPRPTPVEAGPTLHTPEALRDALPEGIYTDLVGEPINVTQAIADHILEKPKARWDGREQYFPLIPHVVQEPSELWYGFIRYRSGGAYAIRRRYVGAYAFGAGNKKRVVGVLVDTVDNQLVAFDVMRSDDPTGGRLRSGRLIYPWKGEGE